MEDAAYKLMVVQKYVGAQTNIENEHDELGEWGIRRKYRKKYLVNRLGEKRSIQVSINVRQRSSDLNEHVCWIVSGFRLTTFAKVIICAVSKRFKVECVEVGKGKGCCVVPAFVSHSVQRELTAFIALNPLWFTLTHQFKVSEQSFKAIKKGIIPWTVVGCVRLRNMRVSVYRLGWLVKQKWPPTLHCYPSFSVAGGRKTNVFRVYRIQGLRSITRL